MPYGVTQTSYTGIFGGGSGYINMGGWNTTLSANAATAQEVVGIKRQDGANTYIYAARGNSSAQPGRLQIKATNSADGQSLIPPITYTNNTAGGTACQWIVQAMAIATMVSNQYGWYLVEGYGQIMNVTNTAALASGTLICAAVASGEAFNQTAAIKNAQGYALTDIACNELGLAFIKFNGL